MTLKKASEIQVCGETILPGESKEINLNVAKLHTNTAIEIPIIIERSKFEGPTVLFSAGIHGDEVNGIEIVRQLIAKGINKPKTGMIICIPIVNIFGFIHKSREFPDGRDLNRAFPGSKNGSLASRLAYRLSKDILPHVDYCFDFHTGGSSRFNAPHVRVIPNDKKLKKLSEVFNAPFILHSKNIKKSFRSHCTKKGIPMLLFEGGKSNSIDSIICNCGVNGSKRVLDYLGMLPNKFKVSARSKPSILITKSTWLRAQSSGMFKPATKVGALVKRGDVLGYITDPYGKSNSWIRAANQGYIINLNESPIVYQGDALFHISTSLGSVKK